MKTNLAKVIFTIMIIPAAINAGITEVSILPPTPTVIDPITISVSGIEGSPAQVTNTDFFVNDNSLLLDIYLSLGITPVVTPWTYSESIGTLPTGVYDLTVRTFIPLLPSFNDNYYVSFEVVPEPGTFSIFTFALPFLRVFTRRKTKGL